MFVSNKITITPEDKYYLDIREYCRKNLILDNPEYIKKVRMGFWVGNTPSNLHHFEINGNDIIVPFGLIDVFKANGWVDKWETDIPELPSYNWDYDLHLYNYQQDCVDAMVKAKHGVYLSAAGSGKSNMMIGIITRLGKRALILTNKKELMQQAKERIESLTDIKVGTITEGKVDIQDITVATVQTMCKLDLTQYATTWGTVIMDEVQNCCGSPTKMAMFYKVLSSLKCWHKYGCTATFHRADKQERVINFVLGDIKYEVPREVVADRIMDVTVSKVSLPTLESLDYVGTDGMINYTGLINYLTTNIERNFEIAEQLNANAEHYNLILSDRVEHLKQLMALVKDQSLCCMVDGSMVSKKAKAERQQAIQDMRDGKKRYLFATYSLAKEGLDIPILDRLYMATPHKDMAVIVQSVGRIARTHIGKGEPIAYDFVDVNIPFCEKAFKSRKTHYKKINCKIL